MTNPTRNVRVALADDHPVVLVAIAETLSRLPGYSIEAAVHSGTELIKVLERQTVDLVITDLVMSGDKMEFDGLRLIGRIRRSWPDLPVVVLTMMNNGGILHELCKQGVTAIVSKEEAATELPQICERALVEKEPILSPKVVARLAREDTTTQSFARAKPLSPRELEVVGLSVQGLSVTAIAKTLNRSVSTVTTQKRSAMRKLRVENHVDLIKSLLERGLT